MSADAKKYEFPTLANWNKNKDVTVTVYVEKPRAPDKGKGLDGTKEHAAGSASRSGPLAPKGNKVGAQVDTESKQLRYSKRHGSDRRAEILRWYQEVNQRSRNQSVGSDSLTDSAMNPTSVNENTHAIMRPKNYEQNLSKNHEVILEKLEARLRKAVPSYPKLRDIYLKSTNTKPQGDYSALVRKQSLKAAKMELSLAGTRKVEPSNIKTRPREKALPKFGQWDLKNLGAETEYTAIFNEARAEKKDRKSVMHSYSQRSPSYRQPILLKQKNRKKWRSFVSKLSAFRSICQ